MAKKPNINQKQCCNKFSTDLKNGPHPKKKQEPEARSSPFVICFFKITQLYRLASLVAQMVKNLRAVQETWVQSLGWEDPLEKGMTTNSTILA